MTLAYTLYLPYITPKVYPQLQRRTAVMCKLHTAVRMYAHAEDGSRSILNCTVVVLIVDATRLKGYSTVKTTVSNTIAILEV